MLTAAISSSSNSFTTSPPPPIPNSLENVEIVSRLKGTLGRAAGSSVILAANTLCSENDSSQSTNSCSSAAERTITQRQVLLLSDDVVGGAQEAVTAWQADHQERQTLLRLQAAASGDDNPPPPPPLYLQGFQETWSFGSSVRQDEGANYDIDHSAVLLRNVRRSLYASGVSLNGEASDFQNLSGVVQTPDQLMIMMADTESGPLQSNRSEENDVIPLFPATVLYNFESGGPQEISLIAGAFVTVYGKVLPNSPDVNINPKTLPKNLSKQEIIDQVNVGGDGWCQVENEIGETGLFPISYLEFMPAIDVEERDATQIPAKDAYNFMFDGDASSATDAAAAVILDLSPNAWVIANNTNTVGVEEEEFYKSLFEGNKHNNNNYDDNPVLSKLPLPRPVMAVTNGTIRFSAIGCSLIEKQRSVSGYRHRSSSQQSNITASSTVSSTNGRLSSLSSWISSSSSNFLNTSNFTRMVMKTWNEVVVGKDDAGALDEFAATIPTVLAESPHRDLEDRARVSSSSSSSMPVQSLSASLSSSSSITTAYGVEKGDRWIGSDSVSEFSVFLEGPRKCQRVNIKEDGVSMHKLEEYLSFKITSRFTNKQAISVFRRFRDFEWLRNHLIRLFPPSIITFPSLPSKILFMNTKSALETRRRALEKYLGIICQHPLVRRCDVFMLFMWCGGDDERDNLSSLSFYISSSEPVSSSSSLQLPQTSPASTTNSHEEKIMTVYEDEDEWLTGMKQHDQAIEAADRAAGFTDRDAGFSSSTITSHFLSRVNLLPSRGIQQQQQDRRTITGFENHLGLLTEHLSELAASSGSTNTSSSIGAGGTSSSLIEKSTLGLNLVVGGGGDYETNNCCSHNHGPFSKPTTDAIKVVAIGKQTDMAANKRSIREFSYCWRPSCTDCKMTSEHLVALSECMEHVRLAQLQQCGSVVSPFMESLSKDLASLVPGYVGVTEFYRLAEKKFVVLDQEGGQNGDQDAGTANNNNNSNMKKLDTIRGVCLAEADQFHRLKQGIVNREVDRLLDGMLETQEYILAQLKELKSKIRGGGGGGG